ncbi:HupE/UreJ family protein, partial [Pseudomonas aeruginosa]|nr:HupE/UreJ family protein [Pseudomonas aeruginosa]
MNSLPMSGATALIARLRRPLLLPLLAFALLMAVMPEALAHGLPEGDKGFIQESTGVMLVPFI